MLDLFAGSGSVGIEALSQGAAHCTFLDLERRAVSTIRDNIESTGFTNHSEVRNQDAFTFLRNSRKRFDMIYVAPPQYKGVWIEIMHVLAERPELLTNQGMIILQIDPREYEPLTLSELQEVDQRKYGNTLLVFFERR